MKKIVLKSITLMMAMGLTLTACSSDDDNDSTQTVSEAELAKIREETEAEIMYEQLCMKDTTQGANVYVSRIGKVLYPITPTVYYTIANSLEEARDYYETIVGVASNDSVVISPMPDDVKRGDVHVSFAASSAQGEVAQITVDCPRLKNVVTSIVFLTDDAWPENDLASPFNFLSLWQYEPNGNYYLTVRDSKGGMGLMLTFDSGWTIAKTLKIEYWGNAEAVFYENMASLDCFKALASCMRYNADKFQKMMNAFAEHGDTNSKTYQVLKRLWEGKADETPEKDRRFIYHEKWWVDKNGFYCATLDYALFEDRKMSLKSRENIHVVNIAKYGIGGVLSHNAWFYSNYKRDDTKFKAIFRN